MDPAVFKGLVYVLLAAGFAAFSFAQIAHTQDYYVQGLGVMPVTSSQYSFVRSYGTSLIPLALYSLYSSLQVRGLDGHSSVSMETVFSPAFQDGLLVMNLSLIHWRWSLHALLFHWADDGRYVVDSYEVFYTPLVN
jgi:hypothetical protein